MAALLVYAINKNSSLNLLTLRCRNNEATDAGEAGGGRTVTANKANPEPSGGVERESSATAPKETMKPQMPAKLAGQTVTVNKANPEPSGGVERESSAGKEDGRSPRRVRNLRQLVSHPPRVTRNSKRNTKRFNISLYSQDKSYFYAQKAKESNSPKRTASNIVSFEGDEHQRWREGFRPPRAPPLSFATLGSRSTPPAAPGSLC